ncbi:MAG: cytochrome c biogenesis protein CcdA [Candidatus Binataceae bacterium]
MSKPSRPRMIVWTCAALALAVAFTSRAAFAAANPGQVVNIESAMLDHPLRAGETSTLQVRAHILAGWHINSDRPFNIAYSPTRVTVTPPAGVSVGPIVYPLAQAVELGFAAGETLSVFSGAVSFRAPLRAGPGFASAGAERLAVTIDYQACNDSLCLRPASVSATVTPAPLASDGRPSAAAVSPEVADDASSNGWLSGVFETRGWALGIIVVLLGGIALNLTPCVYPLIAVTIAYFGNQGGPPRRVVMLALAYVLGIAITFSSLGVAVALSGGLFGSALQNPWLLGALAALLISLAASSFGLFSIQMPQWLVRRAGIARPGYAGAMLMGLGMGVVAAPCIGPIVVGLLVMVERSHSALFGFALFFTLSIGLGLPYIGLALAAGSIRRLPRSGEWLSWVEQLFGFVLIGIALYFLDPLVANRLISRILPFYAAAAGIYLGFVTRAGRTWRPFFVMRSAIGVLAVASLIYLAVAREAPTAVRFDAFEIGRFDAAKSARTPILIDFMADWCIPCREMESTTFIDPAVLREADRFVRLRADLTRQDGANEQIIKQFEIQGVPTTMVVDSDGKVRRRTVGYVGPDQLLKYLREVN